MNFDEFAPILTNPKENPLFILFFGIEFLIPTDNPKLRHAL